VEKKKRITDERKNERATKKRRGYEVSEGNQGQPGSGSTKKKNLCYRRSARSIKKTSLHKEKGGRIPRGKRRSMIMGISLREENAKSNDRKTPEAGVLRQSLALI